MATASAGAPALPPEFAALMPPSSPAKPAATANANLPDWVGQVESGLRGGKPTAPASTPAAASTGSPLPDWVRGVEAMSKGGGKPTALPPEFAALMPATGQNPAAAGASASQPRATTLGRPTDLTDRLANYVRPYVGSIGQQAIRQTGLVGRAVAEAAQRTGNIIPDAANALYQLATDPGARQATVAQLAHPSTWLTMPANAPSSIVSRGLGRVLPTPQTGAEKFAGTVEGLMTGSRMPLFPGVARAPATAAFSRAGGGLTDAQRQAAQGGEELGMRLTPGQRAGSKPLQQFEAALQSHPWTSGPFAKVGAGNQSALNRAVAQSIGENSDTVDSTVLSRANDRLGETFENVRSPNHTIMFNPEGTKAALDGIDQEFKGLLPNGMDIRGNALVQQLEELGSQGHGTAQQFGQLSSKLGRAAFKQMTGPNGDRDLGKALYAIKDHVDDVLESSLPAQERAEYAAAREQYRNLMTLTSRGNIVNPSTGDVSGTALASKLQQADKPGFLYGRNQSPMYQAARFAQAFKPIVGDSGTATRSGGHTGLWTAGLLADALARGVPLNHAIGEAAVPFALRVGSNLGTRAYLTRPGAALVRGAGALPAATARAGRSLSSNPALLPSLLSRAPLPIAAGSFATAPMTPQHGGPSPIAGLLARASHPAAGIARALPFLAMGPAGMSAAAPLLAESPIERLLRGLRGAAAERGGNPSTP